MGMSQLSGSLIDHRCMRRAMVWAGEDKEDTEVVQILIVSDTAISLLVHHSLSPSVSPLVWSTS